MPIEKRKMWVYSMRTNEWLDDVHLYMGSPSGVFKVDPRNVSIVS